MSSLRSLAFILASAIRRARALSSAALDRSPDIISGRKMAAKMATKIDAKMAVVCILVSCEQFTPLGSDETSRPCPPHKYNRREFEDYPGALFVSQSFDGVQPGSAQGRNHTADQTHRGQNDCGHKQSTRRDDQTDIPGFGILRHRAV
jgi:hypothetical protein